MSGITRAGERRVGLVTGAITPQTFPTRSFFWCLAEVKGCNITTSRLTFDDPIRNAVNA